MELLPLADTGITTLVASELLKKYQIEGVSMPYTVEDFIKNAKQEVLKSLTVDDFLKNFPADDILKRFKPDELLKRLKPEEIEAYLRELRKH